MDELRLQRDWHPLLGAVNSQCGKLTEKVATHIEGRQEVIVAKLQEHYGFSREQAEHLLNDFLIKSR